MHPARLRLALLAGTLQLTWLAHGALVTAIGSQQLMTITALALTAVLAAGLALAGWIATGSAARPLITAVASLLRKSWAAAFQRLLNPDSAGRPRPRAPSPRPAAA